MTLLTELLATSQSGPADKLRSLATELQREIPVDGYYGERRPVTTDILVSAEIPYMDGRVQWVALRLQNSTAAVVELYERRTPFNYTSTEYIGQLASIQLTDDIAVTAILQRFVTEARLRKARGVA